MILPKQSNKQLFKRNQNWMDKGQARENRNKLSNLSFLKLIDSYAINRLESYLIYQQEKVRLKNHTSWKRGLM